MLQIYKTLMFKPDGVDICKDFRFASDHVESIKLKLTNSQTSYLKPSFHPILLFLPEYSTMLIYTKIRFESHQSNIIKQIFTSNSNPSRNFARNLVTYTILGILDHEILKMVNIIFQISPSNHFPLSVLRKDLHSLFRDRKR